MFVPDDELQRCLQALDSAAARVLFVQCLGQPKNQQRKVRLESTAFAKLRMLVLRTMDICEEFLEYGNALSIVQAGGTFYREVAEGAGRGHFLEKEVRTHGMSRDGALWTFAFDAEVSRAKDGISSERDGVNIDAFKHSLVPRIARLVDMMLTYGCEVQYVRQFAVDKSKAVGLANQEADELSVLTENLLRAHEFKRMASPDRCLPPPMPRRMIEVPEAALNDPQVLNENDPLSSKALNFDPGDDEDAPESI